MLMCECIIHLHKTIYYTSEWYNHFLSVPTEFERFTQPTWEHGRCRRRAAYETQQKHNTHTNARTRTPPMVGGGSCVVVVYVVTHYLSSNLTPSNTNNLRRAHRKQFSIVLSVGTCASSDFQIRNFVRLRACLCFVIKFVWGCVSVCQWLASI